MPAQVMSPQPASPPVAPPKPTTRASEPTAVQQIIAAARAKVRPARAKSRGAWLLASLTGLLLYASFTPLDWGPLAWVALVPLLLLARIERPTRWMYSAVYVAGLASTVALLQWLRLGDATMYVGWIALSLYLAIYFPLFVGLTRVAVHRFGIPLTAAAPVVWVAAEFCRARVGTGFAWYFLAHTQYRWLEIIQISDVVGAYGVSFVMVLASACLAGLVPAAVLERLRLLPPERQGGDRRDPPQPPLVQGGSFRGQAVAAAVTLAAFGAVLAYGYVRRAQADFREGPRVALVQGNFTSDVKFDPNKQVRILHKHLDLTAAAARHQPDLIVWPETSYPNALWVASPEVTDDQLREWTPRIDPAEWRERAAVRELEVISQAHRAALLVGAAVRAAEPDGLRKFNSAAFVTPERGYAGRYDKMHLVIFGEYIPFQSGLLHSLTPWEAGFGLDAGRRAALFEDRGWRYSPLICFEDTVPHLVRGIVRGAEGAGQPVDVLVNVTNDGWFHGSSELDQHLITSVFRSVECRTPMVRAVNTGISAVIDGDGAIVEPEVFLDGDGQGRDSFRDPETGRPRKSLNAVVVDDVPLDNRASLYVAGGDWFAGTCTLLAAGLALGGVVTRRRRRESGIEQFEKEVAALATDEA